MFKKYPMKMRPVSKEILWGGDILKKKYHKTADFEKLAESWELTVRPDGMSIIDNGTYTGLTLEAYAAYNPLSILGSNGTKGDRFPLLIKFIDAREPLSVQVHPDDTYSLANEGELGKMEMWYIVEATESATLVYGLAEGCTKEMLEKAITGGTMDDVLHTIPVKAGECYFIPAGQIHAIGAGCLIAEIQQNSNITYRVYDYNRRQADGSLRELHIEKALDVIRIRTEEEIRALRFQHKEPSSEKTLCDCQYFKVKKFTTHGGNRDLYVSDSSFMSLLVLSSDNGQLLHEGIVYDLASGDNYFIPAGTGQISLIGSTEVLVTTAN